MSTSEAVLDTDRRERDEHAANLTASVQFLVGKTIATVEARPHDMSEYGEDEWCDSVNVLRLTFADGSQADIRGGYGGYTGLSCDEYIETISAGPVQVNAR